MSKYTTMVDAELLEEWDTELDTKRRKEIVKAMEQKGLFPANFMKQWEDDTGAYPSTQDPLFLQKLLAKREFAESQQETWEPENDPCGDVNKFEVTPVQRFAANLMSPRSPYMSALLFHGVGVGKTCAAVQIAEAWLGAYPKDKIFLVAPPTIQDGFYRTIFDITKIKIGATPTEANTITGCTGDSYLELTGMTYEKDIKRIERRVKSTIRDRYAVFGYQSFANYIESLVSGIDPDLEEEEFEQEERRIISKKFSGKLLIIDEAHNVRDITGVEDDDEFTGVDPGKDDMKAGKQMTPWLLKVLRYSRGLKLVLLTATPMYNSYMEIIFMLNLLLINDKKATLIDKDIFRPSGRIRKEGMEKLGRVASRYVSFMRGENPKSFPIRLNPEGVRLLKDMPYPERNPRGSESIPDEELAFAEHLPIVPIELEGDALSASLKLTRDLAKGEQGISGVQLGKIIQAGNFIPPSAEDSSEELTLESVNERLSPESLDRLFTKSKGEIVYTARPKIGASWLAREELVNYSPKFAFLLDQLKASKGVSFVYMRVVNLGALPLALALEANGYTPIGRESGLLGDGIQAEGGRQCALCERKEERHKGASHTFTPAYYGLLTGNVQLTPNKKGIIDTERMVGNEDGKIMKVIVGSQIAGEGVDLRYVREVHMLDSWYHLNRTEQVIGRAIRFCSHSALKPEKRNATIYLYAAVFPEERNRETGDLFIYRSAFRKAVEVGNVTRALKIRAIDCNLNHEAIIIANQDPLEQIDSKGKTRPDVDINDKPFTAICDWNDSCLYECEPSINIDILTADDSTYSEYAAKWRESELKHQFRELFAKQVFYDFTTLWDELFGSVPVAARSELFADVIDNKAFQVVHNGVTGYITYCNGYYVFQPLVYTDLHIPMAIRAASFPVRRDQFDPVILRPREESVVIEASIAKHSIVETWNACAEWVTMLRDLEPEEEIPKDLPEVLYDRIQQMSGDEPAVLNKYRYILEMVRWLHMSIDLGGGSRKRFHKAVLEYLWDNWFTMKEHLELLEAEAEYAHRMVAETEIEVAHSTVVRLYDLADASIHYICDNKECSAAIAKEVKKAERSVAKDFLEQEEGSDYRIGKLYGFLASHNGHLAFKINNEFVPGTKTKPGGKACSLSSNISEKHEKLILLGKIMEKAGSPDLELRDEVLSRGKRKIENAERACALLELVLRYMDHSKIKDRRWFFRPVMARLIGYSGFFKKSVEKKEAEPVSVKREKVEVVSSEEDEEPVPKSRTLRRSQKSERK